MGIERTAEGFVPILQREFEFHLVQANEEGVSGWLLKGDCIELTNNYPRPVFLTHCAAFFGNEWVPRRASNLIILPENRRYPFKLHMFIPEDRCSLL